MTAMHVDLLVVEIGRVADRLRSMSAERLSRPFPPYASRAAAALAVAQVLADAAASLEGLPSRPVPDLGPLAVGDQIAVTGTDVVTAARLSSDSGLVERCIEALVELRRTL
jgi:hypothetical protein